MGFCVRHSWRLLELFTRSRMAPASLFARSIATPARSSSASTRSETQKNWHTLINNHVGASARVHLHACVRRGHCGDDAYNAHHNTPRATPSQGGSTPFPSSSKAAGETQRRSAARTLGKLVKAASSKSITPIGMGTLLQDSLKEPASTCQAVNGSSELPLHPGAMPVQRDVV